MAEIVFPSTLTVQLSAYAQRLQDESMVAAEKAATFLHDRVVAKAQDDPQWAPLSDHIEVWSQDGQLIVGIRDREYTSQAFGVEYGDEVRPPSPLFRTLNEDMREADSVFEGHMTTKFGREL